MEKRKKGFTLIELLIVVAIIGVLSSVVLSALNSARAKSRDASRKTTIRQVMNALEFYALANGSYPVLPATSIFDPLETSLSVYLVPDYIDAISFDYTNAPVASYYRPSSASDGYQIIFSQENPTQASPLSYMCRTGIGPVSYDSSYYPNTPQCVR